SDGRAALCTWDGDVWIVSGVGQAASLPKEKQAASLPKEEQATSLPKEEQAGSLPKEEQAGSLLHSGKVRWKRFAAGLHQPLGLKIVNDIVYVAGRDQITKLHDLNGDGEADF